jgi:hypothetical protein
LHALVGLGGPCRLRVRWRDHLGRLAVRPDLTLVLGSTTVIAICSIAFSRRFGVEGRQILSDRPRLPLLIGPIEFVRRLAVIAAGIRLQNETSIAILRQSILEMAGMGHLRRSGAG